MKTLYSSTFISIVLAFLMFVGKSGQPVTVIQQPEPVQFRNIVKHDETAESEAVRIEIFDDLFCKSCTDFMKNTLPKIRDLEQETENIDLRLYFIPDINDGLYYQAALSLKCAADQNGFWGMHAKLHEYKNEMNSKTFLQSVKELELNADAFQDCLKEEVYKNKVEEDVRYASEKGVAVKPAIWINEYRLIGNQPFENIQKIINEILKEKQAPPPPPVPTDLDREMEPLEEAPPMPEIDLEI